MAAQLAVGTRIFRPARLVSAGGRVQVVPETPRMKNFGDGTIMLRAALREPYLPDWLGVPWETAGGRVCLAIFLLCARFIPSGPAYQVKNRKIDRRGGPACPP